MKETSACDKCGLRVAPRVRLRDGTIFRVCDLCYWRAEESRDQEEPDRPAADAPERVLAAAA